MTFARDMMAASTISATALFGAILSKAIRKTLLIAVSANPALGARAFAIQRIARGTVLALAIHFAISAPFTQRASCLHEI